MTVEHYNGIGLSRRTSARYISISGATIVTAAPAETKPREDLMRQDLWARWGDDDQLPIHMLRDIGRCGVLESSIHDIARFSLGKGARPYNLLATHPDGSEELTEIRETEIDDWLEENDFFTQSFSIIKDYTGLGNYIARYKFTKNGQKIGLAWRHDVSEMRLQTKDATGKIKNIFLSAQFDQVTTYDPERVIKIPALPHINPSSYLLSIPADKRKNKEFGLSGRRPGWNKHYYSNPGWKSTQDWVDIDTGVPKMKTALFENNIRIKYLVVIHERYWERNYTDWNKFEPTKKRELIEDLWDKIDEYLAGSENSYKSIFTTGWVDPVTQKETQDIHITAIQDNTRNGELLPDSAAADKQIMFSLGFNPAINGANLLSDGAKGGAGSGSDIREAVLAMIMKGELERQQVCRVLNIPAKVNGWRTKYPQLVWRFPGLVLTTLDKGRSTEKILS